MAIQVRENLTPRELMLYEQEKEAFKRQSQHAVKIRELELEASKMESRIGALIKLPLRLLYLPVSLFLVFVLSIYAIRGIEPPKSIIELIKS